MALLILLYLALVGWLAYLNGNIAGFGRKGKVYNIFASLFIWPWHLVFLVLTCLVWRGIIALVSWIIFILYFEKILGIAYHWLMLITIGWFLVICVLWWWFCRHNKQENFFPVEFL